ncbi:WD40/YVTN/BNR-like repeat-containing protein [Archangium lansingense]|uniref:WD40/YVTN/BNR-like repeat-containing protein n=1 Tax=Archangium lansingense TaxID=2995310 RepID=UPI003B7F19B2
MKKSSVTVATVRALDQEFQLKKRFDLKKHSSGRVAVLRGSIVLDHIPLDFWQLDRFLGIPRRDQGGNSLDALSGLIIDGDVTVEGAVMNAEMDFGPFLLVRGDLRARDVACGGSQVRVEGALTLSGALFGFYNHGSIVVEGPTQAACVLTEEHAIRLEGGLVSPVVPGGKFLEVSGKAVPEEPLALQQLSPELFNWSSWVELGPAGQKASKAGGETELAFIRLERELILDAIDAGRPLVRGKRAFKAPPRKTRTPTGRWRANVHYLDGICVRAGLAAFAVCHTSRWREAEFGRYYTYSAQHGWCASSTPGGAPVSMCFFIGADQQRSIRMLLNDGVVAVAFSGSEHLRIDVLNAPAPLHRIRAVADGLVVCGDDLLVYASSGKTWNRLEAGLPEDATGAFRDITGHTLRDLTAVGTGGRVMHFDGESWNSLNAPVQVELHAVTATKDGIAVVGDQGTLLVRGAEGPWKTYRTGDEAPLIGVAVLGDRLYVASRLDILVLEGDTLKPVETGLTPSFGGGLLHACDGVMWCIGLTDLARFDGSTWERVTCPDQHITLEQEPTTAQPPPGAIHLEGLA